MTCLLTLNDFSWLGYFKKYEADVINDMMTLDYGYVHLIIFLLCNTLKQKYIASPRSYYVNTAFLILWKEGLN